MSQRAIPVPPPTTYDELRAGFTWVIPNTFNMGTACCRTQPSAATALIVDRADGTTEAHTFGQLDARSNQLAGHLQSLGVRPGDRVGVVIAQSEMAGVAHLAIWKLGAISLPLASLFGPDALTYRLRDAAATAVITTPDMRSKLDDVAGTLEILVTGDELDVRMSNMSTEFAAEETNADDPALLIYTSGTTGPPKGALLAHRALFGHLPGFELYYEFAPEVEDVIWTPADWAWIGGLMDVLVPAWYHGIPVLTSEHDFSPHGAVALMERHRVTLAFLPPTALKMMRAAGCRSDRLVLRSVFTGGEPLGAELIAWTQECLGTGINEGYGQTECNLVVGNCASIWPVRPGSMGRPIPGHTVAVLDESGDPVVGEPGEVCVAVPDPVMMLGYWNKPDATTAKIRDGWLHTGDIGIEDEDGYLWFVSRTDDVISSMGYRIGPGEIEDSLLNHPAVAMSAVIGVPDEIRGQVPAAFVVLREGATGSDELASELQQHVRTRLAAHEVPRRIIFVDDLPRTTTGKVLRRLLRDQLT